MKEELNKRKVTLRKPWFPSNKRGSHVGLVLSFVIFVVFLIFMYPLVGPALKVQQDKQYLLEPIEKRLLDTFSSTITTITINLGIDISGKDCIKIQNDIYTRLEEIFGEDFDEEFLLIKDETGLVYGYARSGQGIIIDTDETADNPSSFFKIQASNEIDPSPQTDAVGCTPITDTSGIFGLITTGDWIFESKIIEMLDFYEEGYSLFKSDILKISAENEFAYSFEYFNGTIITTPEKDIFTSVYVSEVPILYLDLEGNINSGVITIKTW